MRESLEIPVPLYTGFAIQIPKYPSDGFAEIREHRPTKNDHRPPEPRGCCVGYRIIENRLAVRTERFDLFQSPEAASHSRRHNQ